MKLSNLLIIQGPGLHDELQQKLSRLQEMSERKVTASTFTWSNDLEGAQGGVLLINDHMRCWSIHRVAPHAKSCTTSYTEKRVIFRSWQYAQHGPSKHTSASYSPTCT